MADRDAESAKDYAVEIPAQSEPFFLKGFE